eukprot:GHVH01001141.1.p1 GENE.GHVH01001141.1~~GHVH01001141.1.p1  ORF type:complete len:689 (-),score=120.51 GHVH01001141.1:70-2136(-)
MTTLCLLSALGESRRLLMDVHSGAASDILDSHALAPDHIVYYGNHHRIPDQECKDLTSREMHRRVAAHVQKISNLLAERNYDILLSSYPSIVQVFDQDYSAMQVFIHDFTTAVDALELNDVVLSDEDASDVLRHISLEGLKKISHHFERRVPRSLSVENLRALRADMLHLGSADTLYEAVVSMIDCVLIHPLNDGNTTATGVQPVGYPVHDSQDSYAPLSSATMITDINQLLTDPQLKEVYHPLGHSSDDEPITDPYFPLQWYLGGPPEQPFGADFIRSWMLMVDSESFEGVSSGDFPVDPSTGDLDFNVAIVDMGCGVHDDLLYDASSPICQSDNTKIGSKVEADKSDDVQDLDELSSGDQEGEKVADTAKLPSWGADYCAGATSGSVHLLNEGNDKINESYFEDSSNHGTSTASIIGAGWNDESGIAGLCPFCTVKCIKISVDESDKTQVNMAGIFRSLEFLAAFTDKYTMSNHSYGGFFLDAKEIEGHRRLSEKGHLAVVAAGNYGCDIDPLAEAFGAFSVSGMSTTMVDSSLAGDSVCKIGKTESLATNPMMPASVQFPTKIQVGSIGITGDLSKFSNSGKRAVHLMAPGETLVSLRARNAKEAKAGNDEVIIQHGTSFSAPIVTAAAALVWRRMQEFCVEPSAETVIQLLMDTATIIPGMEVNAQVGGTINVYKALMSIENLC